MSKAKLGKSHPMYGKARAVGAGSPCQKIEVKDILTNKTAIYDSISAALEMKQSTISAYFKRNPKSAYKGRFQFKKIISIATKGSSETSTQEI